MLEIFTVATHLQYNSQLSIFGGFSDRARDVAASSGSFLPATKFEALFEKAKKM